MNQTQLISPTADLSPNEKSNISVNGYASLLQKYHFIVTDEYPYIQAGTISKVQGWILHLSLFENQFNACFDQLMKILVEENVSFKIPMNTVCYDNILTGNYGAERLGKVICIYPENDATLVNIAKKLIKITEGANGPEIRTDFYLGGAVYCRYGGINPLLTLNTDGNINRYIYNDKKKLIADTYYIPFQKPNFISWPFKSIRRFKKTKPPRLLKGKYLLITPIKLDIKGNVIKGINITKVFNIKHCLVKEGRKHMGRDSRGREIKDRLLWQYELQKKLVSHINVPKAIDIFDFKGNTYFVMDWIEGRSFSDIISDFHMGMSWTSLSYQTKDHLLSYLLKILNTVYKLHDLGYLHRDLAPRNFILDSSDELYLIDLELAYNYKVRQPYPPFTLGTPGYMSPEQEGRHPATVKDDVYGIGAIMIKIFTDIPPIKIRLEDTIELSKRLYFLTGDEIISFLIASCLHKESSKRPEIVEIIEKIKIYKTSLSKKEVVQRTEIKSSFAEFDKIKRLLTDAISSLFTSTFITSDKLWYSKSIKNENATANETQDYVCLPGLYSGISGVLHFLVVAGCMGYKTIHSQEIFTHNLQFIVQNYLNNTQIMVSGLYHGADGISMTVIKSSQAGEIILTPTLIEQLKLCFRLPMHGLNIATGVAGRGLAILGCGEVINLREELDHCVRVLLASQQQDGSWLIQKNEDPNVAVYITGFSFGVSGIVYFLLQYSDRYKDHSATKAAHRGLEWLINQSTPIGENIIWSINTKIKVEDPWLDIGFTGVAFVFIKAFEITGEDKYKQIAIQALNNHPPEIIADFYDLSSGLSGIGVVYLEAYRVFKNPHWLSRAHWIVQLLTATYSETINGPYWLTENSSTATADLMTGNTGVAYFLLKYCHHNISFLI